MHALVIELRELVAAYSLRIGNITEDEFSAKPNSLKWSKKEVLGHLIDSAQNNLRRFICGQYETTPPKIRYDQNFWVNANAYQQFSKEEVITLWKLVNEQIAHVLTNMPQENYTHTCDTGAEKPELKTLEFLAVDYIPHMKHHLNQIIPGSFDIVYK